MENKILDKKHIIIISIAILSIIVSYFNATYAYFGTSKNEEISISSAASFGEATVYNYDDMLEGNLTYTSNKSEMLKTTTTFKKDNVDEFDYLLTVVLQVKPHETLYALDEYTSVSYEIYHKTDLSIDTSNYTCTDDISTNGDYCNTGTFIEDSLEGTPFELIDDFRISDTEMHYFDIYIYLNNEGESKAFKANIFYLDKETEKEVVEAPQYINEPDLTTGLIPVVYNENGTSSKWFVADTSTTWYDYNTQWWANAVSIDSSTTEKRQKYVNSDGTYKSGTEIAEADMLAMFVWIPRFSYTIGCTSTTSCYGYKIEQASNLAQATPGAIDIKFVAKKSKEMYTGDSPTYTYTMAANGMPTTDRTPSNWYTHPAFTFGEDGLTGIWVGKFETSTEQTSDCYINDSSSYCNNLNQEPRIIPNVSPLGAQNINNQFETAKKFTIENNIYGLSGDSHMMKNSEWGAVAYLSQSIYGKYGNINYTQDNKQIYKNDSTTYTGRSSGKPPATGASSNGTYKYDGQSTTDNSVVCELCGTGASTTGNIYGIYDMSGGAYENVMGYYKEASEIFGSTSSLNRAGFTNETKPDDKYFDGYQNVGVFSKSSEVIGHATAETKEWYGDAYESLSQQNPWIKRGYRYTNPVNPSEVGIFNLSVDNGSAQSENTFRSVLLSVNN